MVGTVYMHMPLKPNVLDDITKEVLLCFTYFRHFANNATQHWIVAPPKRRTYMSTGVQVYLEDESGRLPLTGAHLKKHLLVTGAIIATMGTENASGEFEVVDVKVADLPRQPDRWERDDSALALKGKKTTKQKPRTGKVAIVSGLGIKGDGTDRIQLDLLTEYLLGESTSEETPQISRLIIAGNSLAHAAPIPSREELAEMQPGKNKYGHETTVYNPTPNEHFDTFLAQLLPSIPITLLPGATDPSGVAIPQQSLHPALFRQSRTYANPPTQEGGDPSWFDSVTNPWEGDIDGLRFLGNAGQPIDDMAKYVRDGDRLQLMEHLLRWRNNAPTAPDTLCEYIFVLPGHYAGLTILRDISFPGPRSFPDERMPPSLLCRQSTRFFDDSN
jgi:DNA polymerase delta subunit 2